MSGLEKVGKAGLRVTVPAVPPLTADGYGRRELVDGDAEGREIVELGFEVLQVEGEVEVIVKVRVAAWALPESMMLARAGLP